MKKRRSIILISLLLSLLVIFTFITIRYSFSLPNESVTDITLARINEIRSTKNTDVSNITGKIFYLSNEGNDSNDGLTINTPWKTLTKLNQMMSAKTVKNGDAVLFRRGDTFRGSITMRDNNITLGSYGNESLPKPHIWGSAYNAAREGEWEEVYPNYWIYKIDGAEKIFPNDIGGVWYFCNSKDNTNCNRTTTDGKTFYAFGNKRNTDSNVEETPDVIGSVLNKDLDFYHIGHGAANNTNGQQLVVYSKGNPAQRFDDIEISLGKNGIAVGQFNNIVIDNLQISFFGAHGIGAGTLANLTVTNCEISYVGGMNQSFNKEAFWALRYGNGVEIYGSIENKTNYPVKDGYVVRNNYIYEIYDAGMTFQYTAAEGKYAKVERAEFDNNVVEYCSYNIEYWNGTKETSDEGVLNNTYINKVYFTNNILRYAGMGYTETRPEHGYEALIKSWDGGTVGHNVIKDGGEFIIRDNILDTTGQLNDNQGNLVGTWMLHVCASNAGSMPTFINNKFYNYRNRNLGYLYTNDTYRTLIPYNEQVKYNDSILKGNTFVIYDEESAPTGKRNGTSQDVSWTMDLDKNTLTISGTGKMADYTEEAPAPWNDYQDYVKDIIIGENVTYIGKRAFANLKYVQNIYFNAKAMDDLKYDASAFYNVGKKSTGTKLIIGSEVTKIPAYLTMSNWNASAAPYITTLVFKGNKVEAIRQYSLSFLYVEDMILPNSVTSIDNSALYNNATMIFIKIPDNVTTISTQLLKNNRNLETIILGKNTTSVGENALVGLKQLKTLVIPSSNFVFPTDITVLDSFSPIGLQIFGPTNLEETINAGNAELGSTQMYFVPMSSYRPIVHGDGKKFITRFDDMLFDGTSTYQAKALANANVNITGAKYRYFDRFNHKHLIDDVNIDLSNNRVSNVYMDVELQGNLTDIQNKVIDNQNVLFLGNSLLRGFDTHGMASTNTNSDYYYYVMNYLKSMNPNIKAYKYTANTWEGATTSEARNAELDNMITSYLSSVKDGQTVKTIFLQLGDNVNSAEKRATFATDLDVLIKRFKSEFPNARIYYVFGWYNYSSNIDVIREKCTSNQIDYIDFNSVVGTDKRYRSYMNARYLDSNLKTQYVDSSGVASHPGDYGFITLADTIVDYLKNNGTSTVIEPSITSNKYTIANNTIIVKPTNKTYDRQELLSNITINGSYEIYNKNTKVTSDEIGTNYEIRIGSTTYSIIVQGDVTGDGKISLGDVSAIYNHYRNNRLLTSNYLSAGLLTGKDYISLGDVSKLYNFYRGNKEL